MRGLMIDFTDEKTGKIRRMRIDGGAFSIRDGVCYFTSDGDNYEVPVEDIFQVYPG